MTEEMEKCIAFNITPKAIQVLTQLTKANRDVLLLILYAMINVEEPNGEVCLYYPAAKKLADTMGIPLDKVKYNQSISKLEQKDILVQLDPYFFKVCPIFESLTMSKIIEED